MSESNNKQQEIKSFHRVTWIAICVMVVYSPFLVIEHYDLKREVMELTIENHKLKKDCLNIFLTD